MIPSTGHDQNPPHATFNHLLPSTQAPLTGFPAICFHRCCPPSNDGATTPRHLGCSPLHLQQAVHNPRPQSAEAARPAKAGRPSIHGSVQAALPLPPRSAPISFLRAASALPTRNHTPFPQTACRPLPLRSAAFRNSPHKSLPALRRWKGINSVMEGGTDCGLHCLVSSPNPSMEGTSSAPPTKLRLLRKPEGNTQSMRRPNPCTIILASSPGT
jgi:hypothetical protein